MKHFLIRYRLTHGTQADWHQDVAAFIAALDSDPELGGRIAYRVMKLAKGADYLHIASPADEEAVGILQKRDFFKRYTEKNRLVAGGELDVSPVEIIGQTKRPA